MHGTGKSDCPWGKVWGIRATDGRVTFQYLPFVLLENLNHTHFLVKSMNR